MMDATGAEAKTIHRLLGWNFITGQFEKNEKNPLEEDFLIVDESSMIDIKLASSLLKATPFYSSVIFIGDIDQLPPVGPGSFFKDLIYSGEVNTSRLTKIYRQGEGSSIVSFSHEINKKVLPDIPSPFQDPKVWGKKDCLFIESDYDIELNTGEYSSLRYNRNINQMIIELYSKIIPKYFGENAEIQVLCPLKTRGGTSVMEINKQLQEAVNPLKYYEDELVVYKNSFRVGDRVMQTKNNYTLDVFNGDIGEIISINKKAYTCVVEFQNKKILYNKEFLKELELARACSIHKSQGSEFDCVIIPVLNEHYIMLYNSLIYTALTRAKKLAIFIGSKSSLNVAVKNVKPNNRQTRLTELIKR
jgi:exodeoxyribonuclease V alpha subunit